MSEQDVPTKSEQDVHTNAVAGTYQHAVREGRDRLQRTNSTLLATGLVGGVDLGFGLLAMLVVRHQTGSELLGALAFSIGFIALVLARSELFTENFLVPVLAVIAREGRIRDVLRLWSGTIAGNLVGGWVMMAIVVLAVPELADSGTILELGRHFVDQGITPATFASAVLGGASMTLLTWMERSSGGLLGKLTAAVAMAFVLAGVPLLHSIVTSLEMFAALQAGAVAFTYLDWLGMFAWAALGNIVGGIGLITVLRLVQVHGPLTAAHFEGELERQPPPKASGLSTTSPRSRR